jgi:hypothetical protein
MDGSRFDSLTKTLAGGVSRREVVRGALGALAGAALAARGRGAGAAPNACAQACAGEPKGPRQAACKQACKRCAGNFNQICFGNTIVCCAGGECCFDDETGNVACSTQLPACPEPLVREGCECVCGNACDPGQFPDPGQGCACVPFPTCDAAGAPENCAAGVVTDCADGACACVDNVDGGNACVERFCTFEACTSGADCAGGPCVSIPDCCGEPNPFCGVPCGSAGTGARSAGWER